MLEPFGYELDKLRTSEHDQNNREKLESSKFIGLANATKRAWLLVGFATIQSQ